MGKNGDGTSAVPGSWLRANSFHPTLAGKQTVQAGLLSDLESHTHTYTHTPLGFLFPFHFNLGPIMPYCPGATLGSRDGKSLTWKHSVMATSHTHIQCCVPQRT